ncbi:MAG: 4-hydroxy-tetrahydrodipicolinate reductase [Planctomycetota bacterium]
MTIRIAIHGAAGRMGRRLVALGHAEPDLQIVAAIDASGHPQLGQDAGVLAGIGSIGVPVTAELPAGIDCVIDFSVPEAAMEIVEACRRQRVRLVLATTGLSPAQAETIRDAAREIPLLWAPSMSLAVNITMKLTELAARALRDKDADVEILERHHRFKEDAPSGTALKFGQIVAAEMGHAEARHGREGRVGKRPHGEIGYHAIRVGDNPGEHTIVFGMLGETIELTVRASSRDCYVPGAFAAARFLMQQPAGLYSMNDALGL